MPAAAAQTSAADIGFNKASIGLAKAQNLVSSWLSSAGGDDNSYPGVAKTDDELEKEEQGIFTLEPELAGLGSAHAPASHRGSLPSNAQLRKQLLLGKGTGGNGGGARSRSSEITGLAGVAKRASKPLPPPPTPSKSAERRPPGVEDDEAGDEDEGRSGVGRAKRGGKGLGPAKALGGDGREGEDEDERRGIETVKADEVVGPEPGPVMTATTKTEKKRGMSFLDEVLAEKARKKQKKKKKKKKEDDKDEDGEGRGT